MFKKYIGFLLCITVFFGSCKTENKENNVFTKKFPEENKIVQYSYILRGIDTVIQGKFIVYNKNKQKLAIGNYYNDKLSGKYTNYFSNGNISQIKYYDKDIIVGDRIFNYADGEVRKYVFHDYKSDPVFIVRFDKNGNVKSYEGKPLLDLKYLGKIDLDSLKTGDKLKYAFVLADVPTAKKTLNIQLLGYDNSKINRVIGARNKSEIEVEERIVKKGKNSVKAILKFTFNDSLRTTITDSIKFDYFVNG